MPKITAQRMQNKKRGHSSEYDDNAETYQGLDHCDNTENLKNVATTETYQGLDHCDNTENLKNVAITETIEHNHTSEYSEFEYKSGKYDNIYKQLAHPHDLLFVKDLYLAYEHILMSKGITPMSYDSIYDIIQRMVFLDHTGKNKSIINYINQSSSPAVITISRYNRINFISSLYDHYRSIKEPLWIYSNQTNFKLSNTILFIILIQIVEILMIIWILLTKKSDYPIFLLLARSAAAVILLNSFLLLSYVSNILQCFDNKLIFIMCTNSSKLFHIFFGIKIILGSILHTIGHVLHVNHVLDICAHGCTLNDVHTVSLGANNHIVISWKYFLSQPAYYTGIILVSLCLFLVIVLIIQKFKIIRIATFYNTHKITAVLLFLLTIIHGVQQLLGFNLSYIFVLPALLIYLYTRRTELFCSKSIKISRWHITDTMIRLYIINSDEIMKQLKRSIALSICINHPSVSKYEWHPFTLSLGINKFEGSLNIKNTGRWTEAFIKKIALDSSHHIEQYINIGHITQSYFRFYKYYTTRIFFCSGIGITPFITIMNNIIVSPDYSNDIFIWSIGDIELIKEFENIINTILATRKLQIFIFYSNSAKQTNNQITASQWSKFNFIQTLIHYSTNIDIVHSIKLPVITLLERINPTNIISRVINNCIGSTKIGVFVCGSVSYSKAIKKSIDLLQSNKKNINMDLWIEEV